MNYTYKQSQVAGRKRGREPFADKQHSVKPRVMPFVAKRHRDDYKLPLHMNDHVPLESCKIMLENIGLSREDVQAMTGRTK